MVPRAQGLISRASEKSRISPSDSLSIILRPKIVAAVSRVRVSLGDTVVGEVP